MKAAFKRYPALLVAAAFAGGIATADRAFVPFYVSVVACLAFAGTTLLVLRRPSTALRSVRPLVGTLAMLLAACTAGAVAYAGHHLYAPHDALMRHVGWGDGTGDVRLTGRVAGPPVHDSSRTVFDLQAHRLGDTPVSGRVRVTVRERAPWLEAGTSVALQGRLRRPGPPRNPSDFAYDVFLRHRGVDVVATVAAAGDIAVYAPPPHHAALLNGLRGWIARALEAHVPGSSARAVLGALLLGDRAGLSDDARDMLARTGLAHLLAVSGLHVLVIGMVLYRHLGPMLTRLGMGWMAMEWTRAAVTLGVLVVYAALTGGRPSVIRAVTMAAAMLGAHTLQRPSYPINALALAGIVLLVTRPSSLFDVGFQLSFAAVAAIIHFVPGWQDAVPARWRTRPACAYPVDMVLVSAAATLGTSPVMLYHFGLLSLSGIVLNVPAIPAASTALVAGLAAVMTAGLSSTVAGAFGAVADLAAGFVLQLAAWGDRLLPALTVQTSLTEPLLLGALVAGAIACGTSIGARRRWRLILAAVALTAVHTAAVAVRPPSLEVVFFDVGQGDAALITFPNGRTLLLDAGPRDAFVDQGERTVVPHLVRHGIRRVDQVLVTHPHSDHLGGLPAVAAERSVGRLLVSGASYESHLVREVERLVDRRRIPVRHLAAGDTLLIDPSVRVHILSPAHLPSEAHQVNDASVVARVQFGTTRFLFMGDAERDAEHAMVARYDTLLAADVVKVGHHGSSTSSTLPMVSAVAGGRNAPLAVVSVAARNRYGLPDEKALNRWAAAGSRVTCTAQEGAVWLRSDGRRIIEVDWRKGQLSRKSGIGLSSSSASVVDPKASLCSIPTE